jgi:hypothetical protein
MKPRRPRHITVTRRWPERYFTALSPTQRALREQELLRRRRTSRPRMSYTNTLVPKRKSKWTQKFHSVYPGLKFNKTAISKRTGIAISNLNTVYNRGLKAWKTGGSRPGASAHQWATARVYKYVLVTKGKAPRAWYIGRYDPDKNLR